jgi:hypothetical protein
MQGSAMYEMAKLRVAEQQEAAQRARQARGRRAEARAARRARKAAPETITVPAIPDFAHEMFAAARDAVPAPRSEQETTRGGRARTSR